MSIKGKLLILGITIMILFGIFTRTIGICITLSIILFSIYILYRYSTRNNQYKKKVSVAQDFLIHKYGDKMGKYILKEGINHNKRKNYTIMLFCLLSVFLLFNSFTSVPVRGVQTLTTIEDWNSYNLGVSSGSNDFVEWKRVSGSEFKVTDVTTVDDGYCLWFNQYNAPSSGWINLTDPQNFSYIYSISFSTKVLELNEDFNIKFYNNSDNIIDIKFKSTGHLVQTWSVGTGDYVTIFDESVFNRVYHVNITHLTGNSMNYTVFDSSWNLLGSVITGTRVSSDWVTFDSIFITTSGSNFNEIYFDNFIVDVDTPLPSEYTSLYFEVYDFETGYRMNVYGSNRLGIFYVPFVKMKMHSDLWNGDYDSIKDYGNTIVFENLNLPLSGSWHYFNFTDIHGIVILDNKIYSDSTNYFKVYPSQTFMLYITDTVTPYGVYSNCKSTTWAGLTTELCTDKKFYTQGESINFRYKAPTEQSLYNVWWLPSNYYYLWIYDTNNLGWLFGNTDGGLSADNWGYINNYAISLDNIYHTLRWDYDASEETGYKTVTGGRDSYKAYIGHGGGGLFGVDSILVGKLKFFITSGIFTPQGNITSVSPNTPELGQRTQITFDSNNNGYITVRNLLAPQETELTVTTFAKFSGLSHVNYTFWDYGEYLLTLYVSSGLDYGSVDSETVSVTTLNGTYGGFGYNVEFLTCEPARVIAGFDTVFVNYRSLSNDGYMLINDSRGQQTPFSTFLGVKTGVLNISIPNYAEIGEWNITLFGNSTLYSNFQVVAEENNWVEFAKNIFYDDEIFEIELKHDRKIEVVFYKDDIAYGRDWYLETGLFSSGIFDVPIDVAYPEIGDWKVEIWQVNNFIKIQKLAEDTCKVIERPPDYEEIVVSDDVTDYLQNIDPFFKGLIGIFIVLLCTFMPFIAIKKLGEHGVNFKVDIPPMLYTICCGIGSIVALILGVWIIQYTFFICIMAGFGTLALYLIGKRNGNG